MSRTPRRDAFRAEVKSRRLFLRMRPSIFGRLHVNLFLDRLLYFTVEQGKDMYVLHPRQRRLWLNRSHMVRRL